MNSSSLSFSEVSDRQLRRDLLKVAEVHQQRSAWRSRIRAAMRPTLDGERLVVSYEQMEPLNSSPTREISEALVRLSTADGLIFPGAFLPAVQSSSQLSRALDRWVLSEVIPSLSNPEQVVAVNLSAASVVDRDLPNFLACLLRLSGVKAQQLIFEITEYQTFDLDVGREVLGVIAEMGCAIAADDFLQGASGLHLLALPITIIKIDGSLIKLIHQPEYQEIVSSLMTLAKRHNLKVMAEWIEIQEQEEIVQNLARSVGVECWGQGWLYR